MKTDQEAAKEYESKHGSRYYVNNDGSVTCTVSSDSSLTSAFLAGCAHRDKTHKKELKEKLMEAFEAGGLGQTNTDGNKPLWEPKYDHFDEWLAEQEDLK